MGSCSSTCLAGPTLNRIPHRAVSPGPTQPPGAVKRFSPTRSGRRRARPLRRTAGPKAPSPQPDGARSPALRLAGTGRPSPGFPSDSRPRPGRSRPARRPPAPAPPAEAPTRTSFRGHGGQDGGAQAVRGEGGGSSAAAMSAARRCSPPRALAGTAARGAARPRRGLGVEGGRGRWGGQGRCRPGMTPGLGVMPGVALYSDVHRLYVSVSVPPYRYLYRAIGVVSYRRVLFMHLTLVLPCVSSFLSVLLVPFCRGNFIDSM